MSGNNQQANQPQNEFLVQLPGKGASVDLNKIIRKAPKEAILRFESGTYQIQETIRLDKPITLIGNGMELTILTGSGLNYLVNSKGGYQIRLEGIAFETKSNSPTTVVQIDGGKLQVDNCAFSGGVIDRHGNQGIGLFVKGDAEIGIKGCRFEANKNAGLWVDGHVQGKAVSNIFDNNESGLIAVGNTDINAAENTFTHNHVGLAYDGSARGTVEKNEFKENRGAILIKGSATPSILNNIFKKNDAAAGFFESCNVMFEGNVITDGDQSLKIGQTAKAVIRKNQLERNDQGIVCVHQSNTEILENTITHHNNFGILIQDDSTTYIASNIIRENSAGMKFEGQASFLVENNQITQNTLYGILATGYSQGKIHRNIIEKNNQDPMGWNFEARESADVDFDDYKESLPQGIPVPFTMIENQWVVSPPPSNERVSFSEILAQIDPGQDVIIEEGEYQLSNPIIVEKPVNLIAKTPGQVFIKGEGFAHLLIYQGNGELAIKGISFALESSGQTNVVVVESGHLIMDHCILAGARDHKANKRDFGAGLLISGTASAHISNSVFKGNLLGISVQNNAAITLHANQFFENGYGIVFRDRSTGKLSGNEYTQNKAYGLMAYDESDVVITHETCHHNQAGFGFINNAKASIEASESHNNEYHGFFIDNQASCEIRNSHSYSNEHSGFAIYGDNQSVLEGNQIYQNSHAGIESAESAQSLITNNQINNNSIGIYLSDNASSEVKRNEIRDNETGMAIQDDARAVINDNKVFNNSEGGIVDRSDNDSTIGENEIFNNGEPSEEEEDQDDDNSVNFGDFLARLLGSEILSDDPNTVAIPLPGTSNEHREGEEEVTLNEMANWLVQTMNDPSQKIASMISKGERLLDQDRFDEARKVFEDAVEFKGDDSIAYVYLGFLSFLNGDLLAAENHLKHAIDVEDNPEDAIKICLLRGALLTLMQVFEEALEDFHQAVKAKLDNSFNWTLYNKIYGEATDLIRVVTRFVNRIKTAADYEPSLLLDGIFSILSDDIPSSERKAKAIQAFNEAILGDPDNPANYWCRSLLGDTLQSKIADFSKAIELEGHQSAGYYLRGYAKLLDADFDGARDDFSKFTQLESHNAEPFEKLGLYYLHKSQDFDEAIVAFSDAIELDPDNPNLYYYRGKAYEKMEQWESAIEDLHSYLEKYNKRGLFNQEQVLERIDQISKGVNTAGLPDSEIDDGSVDILGILGSAFGQSSNKGDESKGDGYALDTAQDYVEFGLFQEQFGAWDLAIEEYSQAISMDPTFSEAYYHRGWAFMETDFYDKAVEDFTIAIGLNPENTEYYRSRAICYMNQDKKEQALNDLDTAIKLNSDNPGVYSLRASLWFKLGDTTQALADCDVAINLDPENSYFYLLRGKIKQEINNLQGALDDFNQAQRIDPDNEEAIELIKALRDRYGDALTQSSSNEDQPVDAERQQKAQYHLQEANKYFQAKKWGLAVDHLTEIIKLDQQKPNIYLIRSHCYHSLGEKELGLKDINKVIDLDPTNAQAILLRAVFTLKENFEETIDDLLRYFQLTQENASSEVLDVVATFLKLEDEHWHTVISKLSHFIEIDFNKHFPIVVKIINRVGADQLFMRLCNLNEYNSDITTMFVLLFKGLVNTDVDKTLEILSESIKNNPEDSFLYYFRCMAYQHKQDWDAALRDINKAIDIDPDNYNYYKTRAEIFLKKNFFTNVINDYEKYLSLAGDEAEDREQVEHKIRELKKGIYPDEELLNRPNKTSKKNNFELAERHINKGNEMLAGNGLNLKGAINEFQKAINAAPDYAMPYSIMFAVYYQMGDWERALTNINEAIRIDPNDANSYNSRAAIYTSNNRIDEAIKDLETTIQLDPNHNDAHINLVFAYIKTNDWDKALEKLNQLIEINSEDPRIYYLRGYAHENKERLQDAIEDFLKYCALGGHPQCDKPEIVQERIKNLKNKLLENN